MIARNLERPKLSNIPSTSAILLVNDIQGSRGLPCLTLPIRFVAHPSITVCPLLLGSTERLSPMEQGFRALRRQIKNKTKTINDFLAYKISNRISKSVSVVLRDKEMFIKLSFCVILRIVFSKSDKLRWFRVS